ncbi:MAG: hypothetical protein ACOYS2_02365 [Patescibacteria group bacterium]
MGIENRESLKKEIQPELGEGELRKKFVELVEKTRRRNGFCEIVNPQAVAESLIDVDLEILRKFLLAENNSERLTSREFQEYRQEQFEEDESKIGMPNEIRRFFASYIANQLTARDAREELARMKKSKLITTK